MDVHKAAAGQSPCRFDLCAGRHVGGPDYLRRGCAALYRLRRVPAEKRSVCGTLERACFLVTLGAAGLAAAAVYIAPVLIKLLC